MARRRKLTEGKKNIIAGLIEEYDIKTANVSDITDKIMPQIEEWQNRPLSSVYPIVFIDCIHFSVRDEHIIKKLAAYIILGVNADGYKEVLSITVGENHRGLRLYILLYFLNHASQQALI